MIYELGPFLTYDDSLLQWLASAPDVTVNESWKVVRLGQVTHLRSEKNRPGLKLLSVFLGKGVIPYEEGGGQVHKPSIDLSGYQVVYPGDLVLNNQQAWRGSVGVSGHHGIISPAYVVLALDSMLNPRFADYLFKSRVMVDQFVTSSKGVGDIQRDIHLPWLKNVRVPIPSAAEQSAIVRFLDHVYGRIQRHLRAKQRLSKLLEEQKEAVIHRAVTRGLDPRVHLAPLGSAPGFEMNASWQVARLWQIGRIRSEKGRPDLDLLSVFLGRGVIPYGEGGGQVHKPSLDLAGYQVVYSGDLVLNNQQAWRGSVGVSKYQGIISPAYVVIDLADSLDSRYADYLFQSRVMVSQFVTSSKGVGDIQRDVHIPWLKNARVPIPPLAEQQKIAASLDQELADIRRQLSLLERETVLLGEYRTRLIGDVVTGRVDVRGIVAQWPDEPGAEISEDIHELMEDEKASEEGDIEGSVEEANV